MGGSVHNDLTKWRASTEALLELDARGALVPHGIGGLARELLEAALVHTKQADATAPFEWVISAGRTFALLPVKCEDGTVAWLCRLEFADVNTGMFYSPYTTRRVYRRVAVEAGAA
jgi:hypothetical protein